LGSQQIIDPQERALMKRVRSNAIEILHGQLEADRQRADRIERTDQYLSTGLVALALLPLLGGTGGRR